MNENLLEKSGKPQGLPDIFWDESKGEVKLKELITEYNSLIARDTNLVESNNRNMPESFDKYDLKIPHPLLEKDDEVLQKLFDNGFNNSQAQLVYDLANERVIPYLEDMSGNMDRQKHIDKLTAYFGSEEKFNEVSRQVSSWAKSNLSAEVYDSLATTSEGVIALYKMMSSGEPAIGKETVRDEELNEDTLKKMVQDPRYWQEKDKNFIAKVTRGYERLYPDKK